MEIVMKNIKSLSLLLLMSGSMYAADQNQYQSEQVIPELYSAQGISSEYQAENEPMAAVDGCMILPVESFQQAIPVNESSVESSDMSFVEETEPPTMRIMRCGTLSPVSGDENRQNNNRKRKRLPLGGSEYFVCDTCCAEENLETDGQMVCDMCHEKQPVQKIIKIPYPFRAR